MTQIRKVKMTDTVQTLTYLVNEIISKINTISESKVSTWGDLKKENSK